jgi:mandelate racemase
MGQVTIQDVCVRAVRIPMQEPHQTATGSITESPLVLTDIRTDGGVVGHSYVFAYTSIALKPLANLIANLQPLIQGDALTPLTIERKLAQRFRLLGSQGLAGMAMAAIDMAVWDALARVQETSLMNLLGAAERPLRAYGAVGFDGIEGSAQIAARWAERGFSAVKAKIGYRTLEEDIAVIRAMRDAVGANVAIMVDYNQSLSVAEAINRVRHLDDEGITWIEEPVLAHDFHGMAEVALTCPRNFGPPAT